MTWVTAVNYDNLILVYKPSFVTSPPNPVNLEHCRVLRYYALISIGLISAGMKRLGLSYRSFGNRQCGKGILKVSYCICMACYEEMSNS